MDPSLLEEIKGRLGTVIGGQWKLIKILGLGASATVYHAVNGAKQRVAIKILHERFHRLQHVRHRFFREHKVLDEVQHPNVLRIFHSSAPEDAHSYMVMELLEGASLAQIMNNRKKPMDLDDVLDCVETLLEVLHMCHSKEILHRDLKPANLFLTNTRTLKVLDFGVAKFHQDGLNLTREGTTLGTPAFMSPEQASGYMNRIDARSDIFSVGATMHYLLCAQYLHDGSTADETFVMAASTPAPSLGKRAPNLPRDVVRMVDKAVEWDPDARFASCKEMLQHLRQVRHTLHPTHTPMFGAESLRDDPIFRTIPAVNEHVLRRHGHLRDIFDAVGRTALAMMHHDPHDPHNQDTTSALEEAYALITIARQDNLGRLVWVVSPYGFEVRGIDESFWTPKPPIQRVPYNLYASGIREIEWTQELDQKALRQFIAALLLDPKHDLAAEDDLASALWDMTLCGVQFKSVTTLTNMEHQTEQALYASIEQHHEMIKEFYSCDLEEERHRVRILRVKGAKKELIAQEKALLQDGHVMKPSVGLSGVILDEHMAHLIHAHHLQVSNWMERLATTLGDTLIKAFEQDDAATLISPIKNLLMRMIRSGAASDALSLYTAVLMHVPHTAERISLNTQALDRDTFNALCEGLQLFDPSLALQGHTLVHFKTLLRTLGPTHVGVVIRILAIRTQEDALTSSLQACVLAHTSHHAHAITAEFMRAPPSHALAMLAMLQDQRDLFTKMLTAGLEHQDPHIHTACFDTLWNLKDPTFQANLGMMVNAPYEQIRRRAMATIAAHDMQQFVHTLTPMFFDAKFCTHSADEQRESFEVLRQLNFQAAEHLATEWLRRHDLASEEHITTTRVIAAEFLGAYALSDDSTRALDQMMHVDHALLQTTAKRALDNLRARTRTPAEGA